jgi:molecular chaperone HscB
MNAVARAEKDSQTVIDFSRNYFDLFGLPRRFHFDPAALDVAYRELQREVHPDRFAASPDAERRLALQSSARVNEAYRALKDPVARAHYLLSLDGGPAPAQGDGALSAEFLERQLDRREAVSNALAARDAAALAALRTEVLADAAREEQRVAELLDRGGDADRQTAREVLRELTFLVKLAADIDAMQADLDD